MKAIVLKRAVAVLPPLLWAIAATAADKQPIELQKTFDASMDRVYAAEVQSVGSLLKASVKEACMVNFNTSIQGYLIRWTATCQAIDNDKTIVSLSIQYADWFPGVGGYKKKQAAAFFSNMETFLRNSAAPAASSEKRPATAPTGGNETVGLMSISSEPTGAEITIDGDYAGSTPSKLSLKPGLHVVRIAKSGYVAWERNIKMETGESRSVVAELLNLVQ